ncbi:MAG: acetyl-CoA synthetase [Chloroflexi bacterium RBG_13_57_8]|nr:MAG: acetyl-CoA synthetase [Chloroflexi bacterium RBG_13_57_8]
MRQKKTALTEIEAKETFKEIGVPVVETRLATSQKQAVEISAEIGFPVVLKIASPDIIHKSDAGGVRLGLKNNSEVAKAYRDIVASAGEKFPGTKINGVAVQKMARPGTEIIIGVFRDAQLGPVIMFGLGGIFVEALKDVAFRMIPIKRRDAAEMIKEIKGYTVLLGYRGQEPVDIHTLEDILMKVSDFAEKNPEIKEIDLNPIFAYKDSAIAADARIVLEES